MAEERIKDIAYKYGNLLKKSILFKGFDDEKLLKAFKSFDAHASSYKKSEFLHPAGAPLRKFGFILSGIIQVCMDDLNGNRMIMANVSVGDSFGESLSFLQIEETLVYIQAVENSEILWLSPPALFESNPDDFNRQLMKKFTELLAFRTLSMNSRIQILSKLTIREKLLTYFSEISSQTKSSTFTVPLSRDDMASFIGTNRSALSRELSLMKKDGILDYYKNTFKLLKK